MSTGGVARKRQRGYIRMDGLFYKVYINAVLVCMMQDFHCEMI